jgi:hypothetical protein
MTADVHGLILQVLPAADSDAEELADLATGLQSELLDVDAARAAPLPAEAVPQGAKGFGDVAGWRPSSRRWTGCAPPWPRCAAGPRGRAGPWRSAWAGMS